MASVLGSGRGSGGLSSQLKCKSKRRRRRRSKRKGKKLALRALRCWCPLQLSPVFSPRPSSDLGGLLSVFSCLHFRMLLGMSTLSRALVSSNLFVNSLGAFLKPDYSQPARRSAENILAGDTGKRAERAELWSILSLMLVSWVPPFLQETQGWHSDTLGANNITGCQKKHSHKPMHIKKGNSSRSSSSHPNCLRGKKRAKPWQLPSQIAFFFSLVRYRVVM